MTPRDALWVVTTYFNPAGYRSRRENYRQFRAALGDVPCLTVECALADRPFELSPSDDLIQLRARDALWHKERLINLAIERLPRACHFVAWIDADVLFQCPDWPAQSQQRLTQQLAVQLFSDVVQLPSPKMSSDDAVRTRGFVATITDKPSALSVGRFDAHGHTGYAWATHRAVLEVAGLYDACIVGSADHLMAHAFLGNPTAECVTRLLGTDSAHLKHFTGWSARLHSVAQSLGVSGLGFVPGALFHLWHGEIRDRRYFERNQRLRQLGFDPARDLIAHPGAPYQLSSPDGQLAHFVRDYFAQRNEDG
ncbi:MAG: hypothetical protein JNM40_18705 [Myxococcales bacterium]|nr:hypothetical protein [Myxococcales bacterium]